MKRGIESLAENSVYFVNRPWPPLTRIHKIQRSGQAFPSACAAAALPSASCCGPFGLTCFAGFAPLGPPGLVVFLVLFLFGKRKRTTIMLLLRPYRAKIFFVSMAGALPLLYLSVPVGWLRKLPQYIINGFSPPGT